MLYAAYVQVTIYASPPCYAHPRACPAALTSSSSSSYAPNNVHIALQAPAYFLMGLSEIFASVTGLEVAFTQAPESMKSLVMSVFLLTTAGGAMLGALVSPFAEDPSIVGLYLGLGAACAVVGCVFWGLYRGLDREDIGEVDDRTEAGMPVGVNEVASVMARESLENKRS